MTKPTGRFRTALNGSREKTARDWFRITNFRNEVVGDQASDGEESRTSADVYVYESIGGWFGMTADDFVRDVAALDVDHIDVHLNSPGGSVFEGVAMANVLRQHRADVTVWVDGIAASAASVVAMAGDEVVMGVGAQLMIHNPSSVVLGQAADMRKEADVLDGVAKSIAHSYSSKAGGTTDSWLDAMDAETWYTAEEAVTAGLADRVASDEDKGRATGQQVVPGSSSSSLWDWWDSASSPERHAATVRALYAYAGRDAAPAPRMPGRDTPTAPAASAGGSTPPQEDDDMSTLTEGLRQRLGIAEDADEATILAAVEQMKARADAPKLPDGAVAIEKDQLEHLKAAAKDGQEAREQQRTEARERRVAAAVADGRIAPARKEHWLNALKADPEGAEASLTSLEPGLIPVAELGHSSNDSNHDVDADALYAAVYGKEG